MSKRDLEFDDYNDPKKRKINDNPDYNRCSPLLFFDIISDNLSNQNYDNNNVNTEIYEKKKLEISNGFSHSQDCEKPMDSNHRNVENNEVNGICELLSTEILKNGEVGDVKNNEENISNGFHELSNPELMETDNINEFEVSAVIANSIESVTDNTQNSSSNVETSIPIENSIIANSLSTEVENENKSMVQNNEIINDLQMNGLTEIHSNESFEGTTTEISINTNANIDYIDEKQDQLSNIIDLPSENNEQSTKSEVTPSENNEELTKSEVTPSENNENSSKLEVTPSENNEELTKPEVTPSEISEELTKSEDTPTENNEELTKSEVIPNESNEQSVELEDDKKVETVSKRKSKTQKEVVKADYKLRKSNSKLEITPQKDKPTRVSARISKAKETPAKEKKTPVKEKTPLHEKPARNSEKKIKEEKTTKSIIESDMDKEPAVVNRRVSMRIQTRTKIKMEEVPVPKETPIVDYPNNPFDKIIKSMAYNDPGTWPQEVPNDMKIDLIGKGPVQFESRSYPRDERNRCFSANNYLLKLSNGEKGRRFWLVYSISQDAAYCFPCRLFSYDSNTTLANVGSKNWKKLNERLCAHDTNKYHLRSMEKWAQFSLDNEGATCGLDLTLEQVLKLAGQVKNFASNKSNNIYLLAKQLEIELRNNADDLEMDIDQE